MSPASPPLAILSFNRPDYLGRVLRSLLAQRQGIAERPVYLFQDGAQSAVSGKVAANQSDIDACVRIFRETIPWGELRVSPVNIGVAQNFRRAEEELLSDPANECVYFFEDDLELAPRYLDVLDNMRLVTEDTSIPVGYFAAYGHLSGPADLQRSRLRAFRRLSHHWAFGLRRSHWLKMQPMLQIYYRHIAGLDYSKRDHAAIKRELGAAGAFPGVTSQDDVKKAITYAIGAVSLNSTVVHARYIGEMGLHMNPDKFVKMGFAATEILPDEELAPDGFQVPKEADLQRFRTDELAIRERAWEAFLQQAPAGR
jgi:hypothetical protein